ncbi:hypothetical protein EHP00_2328 [Ecytonucleospora hepatopenaei]|uniref:Uncharacterized protein n=1 Tax=Ecytonucleospora hepatopenaei TaxID=646526 RepID=A0A1W0E687_9MICR|nr:hypothetical protein EHP00_2328 [Ecytonucleospora hepatopenaei]
MSKIPINNKNNNTNKNKNNNSNNSNDSNDSNDNPFKVKSIKNISDNTNTNIFNTNNTNNTNINKNKSIFLKKNITTNNKLNNTDNKLNNTNNKLNNTNKCNYINICNVTIDYYDSDDDMYILLAVGNIIIKDRYLIFCRIGIANPLIQLDNINICNNSTDILNNTDNDNICNNTDILNNTNICNSNIDNDNNIIFIYNNIKYKIILNNINDKDIKILKEYFKI